jgi:hypothetical protein
VALYTVADKAQVALSATFIATPAALNRKLFTSMYRVTAGIDYVAAVLTNRYAFTLGDWPHDSGNMEAFTAVNGRFFETTAGVMAYPDNRNPSAANYHVSPVYDRESIFVSGAKWQLWKRESPISSSTLIQNIEIGGGIIAGIGFTWQDVPGVADTALNQNEPYFVTVYHPSSDPGDYLFDAGFGDPTNGSLSGSNIYHNGGAATDPPDDETFTDGAFAVDIEINDDGSQIIQVTETGTVFPVSGKKSWEIGQVVETGTVFPRTLVTSAEIGQVVETSSLHVPSFAKAVDLGQVVEVGEPQPISAAKYSTLGQVIEVSSVFSVSDASTVVGTIGQVIEFGSPGRLGPTPDIDTRITIVTGHTLIEL